MSRVTLKDLETISEGIAMHEGWMTQDEYCDFQEALSEQRSEFISAYIHSGGCQFDAATEWNWKMQETYGSMV